MSWLFSRALVEEYLPAKYWDGAPFAQLNVMPTRHKFLRNDKTIEFSNLSRFGLTCAVLTAEDGEVLLMSFLADFRVKTLVQQDAAPGLMAQNQVYGEKWRELSMRYDRNTCLWKTHHSLSEEGLCESSVTLPKWGLTANGLVFQRKNSVRLISGIDCGWLGETFATPQARDYRSGSRKRWNDPRRSRNLNDQLDGLVNPDWEEWLMGWPIGWTELKPLAMDRYHEWLQQHSTSSV